MPQESCTPADRAVDGGQGVAGAEIAVYRGDADATAIVWKATTDLDGNFELPHRVPPGHYRIFGLVPGSSGNPFEKLMAIDRSTRTLEVVEGTDVVTQDVSIGNKAQTAGTIGTK